MAPFGAIDAWSGGAFASFERQARVCEVMRVDAPIRACPRSGAVPRNAPPVGPDVSVWDTCIIVLQTVMRFDKMA